ncbi:MAG: hypothetical protein JWQ90_5605 [Hydrocarboniphaga sp.]|uniref:hypothetical protein n=1 Tax=Hydrocarboniphaga sp. TaxID=2033016 RepID=UPI0026139EC1|nr:hypothetical protein [Hydrocarboniphaga sp.]MDB5973155.1 hypothetical protein [Hydrocarboniphaga sp.]
MVESSSKLLERVREQFPALFITLVSVLVGLVFQDLVTEARARMTLWPLTTDSLLTWGQLFANGTSALTVWIVYSHIGISRRHIPTLGDSIVAVLPPILILAATSFVGRPDDVVTWFYLASAYLASCVVAIQWTLRLTLAEDGLASFRHLLRPTGLLSIPYFGAPFYAAIGWADQHGFVSPWLRVACAALPAPAALMCSFLFFRDWHRALYAAE